MARKLTGVFVVYMFLMSWASCSLAAYYDEGRDGYNEYDAYIIDSPEDLKELADRVNNGTEPSGRYYTLHSSLDFTNYPDWNPIGSNGNSFTGHFNGNYNTINLNITGRAVKNSALFGEIRTDYDYAIKKLMVRRYRREPQRGKSQTVLRQLSQYKDRIRQEH